MSNDEIRKIVREEIQSALDGLFSDKRLSEMEENLQRERRPERWSGRFDYQVDRLSFYADRLAFLAMKLEGWGSECACKYSASDIQHIKEKVEKL